LLLSTMRNEMAALIGVVGRPSLQKAVGTPRSDVRELRCFADAHLRPKDARELAPLLDRLPLRSEGTEERCEMFDDLMQLLGPVGYTRFNAAVHRLVFSGSEL